MKKCKYIKKWHGYNPMVIYYITSCEHVRMFKEGKYKPRKVKQCKYCKNKIEVIYGDGK